MMRAHWVHSATVALVATPLVFTAPAFAQDSRYSSNWGTPPSQATAQSGEAGAAQRLVDELNRLVDDAEKARAADPVLLRDLRDLARRYDWPWSVRVLSDDWSDGDATKNPAWNVSGAPISIDARYGLRTLVERAAAPAATTGSDGGKSKPADVALQIFGQILQQQAQRNGGQQQQQPAAAAPEITELSTTASVSNAFALELDVYVNERPASGEEGRFEIGVGQGAGAYGYRLAAVVGAQGGSTLELLRIGSRGMTVADRTVSKIDLADGATHRVQMTRDRAGSMRLLVDGTIVSEVSDRAFNDGFDRVMFVNRGGDFTLRSVAVYGVN